ncbi:GlcG/HbpS family heme-binding protein [Streptomyces sp. Isolate_219]|uniref:GlcG/HbpS family heme-binding protein n=1 Tax=Streptomyces sp. Isolate_219 TaxID=2950110 RepID=UPI0021C7D8D6|nr:heme-binding protein [Streptomyces sp. Isolate_219]MCR8578530.1 heme-binding protein [Streptomyces sp. Isolate_219]
MKAMNPVHKKFSRRARVATGGAVLTAVAVSGFGAVSANASAPAATSATAASASVPARATTTSTHLTIDAAAKAAQAALDAAEKENQRVTVAVVDRNGNTIVTLRGDGAGPQSYESAERKAFTAAAWNAPTSQLAERLQQAPNLKDIPGTLFLAGGVPVTAENAPIAGIGVAGAPSGALDEKFAQAGANAVAR